MRKLLMRRIVLVVSALATASFANGDGPPITVENFTWTLSETVGGLNVISCNVVNKLGFPITTSVLTFDLYAADGTKIGERFAFMTTVPAGERILYSTDLMPEYDNLPRPVAYVKIGKLEGNVEGVRYSLLAPGGIPEVWNPYIVAARLNAEAKAKKQAEKDRKKAEKERKKAEKAGQ